MNRPTWNNFIGKNFDNNADAFEALARLLFKRKYGIGDSLPYFKNNKGIETHPIEYGKDIIGFQAKFFVDEKIKAPLILDSLKKACEQYPDVTRFIVYTNAAFGNPLQGKNITAGEKSIEDYAKEKGIVVEWICGNDVLDLVQNNELAYNVFFNLHSNLCHLQKYVDEHNKQKLRGISNCISIGDKEIKINRSKYVNNLDKIISNDGNIIISGGSGSGKSAIVKSYCEFISINDDCTFFILDASVLGLTNINEILIFSKLYDLDDFCAYFEGVTHKFIIIDSAEKLTLYNLGIAMHFIRTLKANGWSFVLTCRENSVNDIANILKETNITYDIIPVEPETIANLNVLAKDYNIKLPNDPKLLKQLTYPFYLARYCELSDMGYLTLENFREEIWKRKVGGDGDEASRTKRQTCLTEIVRRTIIDGYYVPYGNIKDSDSAVALFRDDVLGMHNMRCYIKHDIYADLAWYNIIKDDFEFTSNYESLFEKEYKNIQYINAFKTWLSERIEKGEKEINTLSNIVFNDGVPSLWREAIFECIGRSECYAQEWFKINDKKLSENDYKIFNEFVDVLCVSCHKVEYVEFKGKTLSRSVPIGSGWNMAIDFIWAHVSEYYQGNLEYVYKLLSRFSPSKDAPKEIFRYAGLLSLRIFDTYAESRKTREYCSYDESKEWARLVCTYSLYIEEELRTIFNQVVENNWVSDEDPYAELISYILGINSVYRSYYTLFGMLRKEIMSLMNLFWKEPTSKGYDASNRSPLLNNDYFYGINLHFAGYPIYSPSSAFQTPIYKLLKFEGSNNGSFEVIDFIIDFVDDRVQVYKERNQEQDKPYEINIKLRSGQNHKILVSNELWCLYSGTNNSSSLIESIHMALEKYLLEMANEDSKKEYVSEILWRVFEKSHSCSLYSIAASIMIAHPLDYFEQMLFMLQDIHFLFLDAYRFSLEQNHKEFESEIMEMGNIKLLGYGYGYDYDYERYYSNKLPHRKSYLNKQLIEIQFVKGNDKIDKKQFYEIIDRLKLQINNLSANEKKSAERLIRTIDARSFKSDDIKNYSNIYMTHHKSPQVQERQHNRDEIESLHEWIYYRSKDNYKRAKKYEYDKDFQKALKLIREKNAIVTTENQKFLREESFLPSSTSALLLLQFNDQLNNEEKIECAINVLAAPPNFILSHSFSNYEMYIAVIPIIIELMPNEYDKLEEMLVTYASYSERKNDSRPCDCVYRIIGEYSLWEKNRDFMDGVLDKFRQNIKEGDFTLITPHQAESLLCLLSKDNPLREVGKLCIEKISMLWMTDKKEARGHYVSHFVERLVADYIIHAPKEEVKDLISFFKSYLKGLRSTFLDAFSTICAEHKLYDNFWLVWNELYESVINEKQKDRDVLINSYLLNPKNNPPKFNIEKRDVDFFKRVANDMGEHPSVICSILKLFMTIGQEYFKEMIPTIDKLCENLNILEGDKKEEVMFYLENMMRHLFTRYNEDLKKDDELRTYAVNILISMRDNDSITASDMLSRIS